MVQGTRAVLTATRGERKTMSDLNTTAKDLLAVRAMIAELEAEAETLTDRIKAAMVEQGSEVLAGDGWQASWKNVTCVRFDAKAFRADHEEVYAAYSKPVTTCRFLISA